jgi:tetratricopeptide (TPR) repeat protein
MSAVRAHFAALSAKYGYEIPVTVKTLSGRGFQLIREQRFEEAAALFKLNSEAFPDSPEVFHNLAFLYERTRRWDLAAASYEKAAEKAAPADPGLAKFFKAQAEQARGRAKK